MAREHYSPCHAVMMARAGFGVDDIVNRTGFPYWEVGVILSRAGMHDLAAIANGRVRKAA